MAETQLHFKLNGIGLCQNRASFKLTSDRREVTCQRCLRKLTQIYERVLRWG